MGVWQSHPGDQARLLEKRHSQKGNPGPAINPYVGRGVLNVRCVQTAAGV